jgi:hypothetical protein
VTKVNLWFRPLAYFIGVVQIVWGILTLTVRTHT